MKRSLICALVLATLGALLLRISRMLRLRPRFTPWPDEWSDEVETFDVATGASVGTMLRSEFYAQSEREWLLHGKVLHKVKVIRMLLLDPDGNVWLMLRSGLKKSTAGKRDKTIGGHVRAGHSWDHTVIEEGMQELALPVLPLVPETFLSSLRMPSLLLQGAVARCVAEINDFRVMCLGDECRFEQPYITRLYVGYTRRRLRPANREAASYTKLPLRQLRAEIARRPERYTPDLIMMIGMLVEHLVPLKNLTTEEN